MAPAGAYFGWAPNQYANAAYSPNPQSYFGRSQAVYGPSPQSYFGRCPPTQQPMQQQPCPPAPCPPGYGDPRYGLTPQRVAELAALVRHPLGQWPQMPPLDQHAVQDAAALTVAASQVHADALRIAYGIDSGTDLIPDTMSATITVTPQKRHIPEKLVMSEAMAGNFLITGIFAGVEPVLATTGPIAAAMFVQDSTVNPFKSVIMDVGMDFSVGVTNISGNDRRFTAGVVGKPVPPGL